MLSLNLLIVSLLLLAYNYTYLLNIKFIARDDRNDEHAIHWAK